MTDREFAAILRGTKIDGFRRTYRDLPPEHRDTATYSIADEDGTYRVFVMTIGRAIRWGNEEWERVAGHPALSPELD